VLAWIRASTEAPPALAARDGPGAASRAASREARSQAARAQPISRLSDRVSSAKYVRSPDTPASASPARHTATVTAPPNRIAGSRRARASRRQIATSATGHSR